MSITVKNEENFSTIYKLIFASVLSLICLNANSKSICLKYDNQGSVLVSAENIDGSIDASITQSMDNFLTATRDQDISRIVNQFYSKDGSREHAAAELKAMPDKYSGYQKISSSTIQVAFSWGDYTPVLVNYRYGERNVVILENLVCEPEHCHKSNIFSRPDEPTNLFSRWLFVYKKSKEATMCPNTKPIAEILPISSTKKEGELKIYFKGAYSGKSYDLLAKNNLKRGEILGLQKACGEFLERLNLDHLSNDDVPTTQNQLISLCTINAEQGSMIPVNQVGSSTQKSLYTPLLFFKLIKSAQKITFATDLRDSNHLIKIFFILATDGKKLMISIPIKDDNAGVIDWNYYGSPLGELIGSSYFSSAMASMGHVD
jgi:hypothetical protein